jgi:hypothetical protein
MRSNLTDALCHFAEYFLNDFLPFTLGMLAFSAIVFGGWAAAYVVLAPRSCAAEWADYEHRWSFHGGCQIKIDDRWVPTNAVKIDLRRVSAHPAQAN